MEPKKRKKNDKKTLQSIYIQNIDIFAFAYLIIAISLQTSLLITIAIKSFYTYSSVFGYVSEIRKVENESKEKREKKKE